VHSDKSITLRSKRKGGGHPGGSGSGGPAETVRIPKNSACRPHFRRVNVTAIRQRTKSEVRKSGIRLNAQFPPCSRIQKRKGGGGGTSLSWSGRTSRLFKSRGHRDHKNVSIKGTRTDGRKKRSRPGIDCRRRSVDLPHESFIKDERASKGRRETLARRNDNTGEGESDRSAW